VDSLVYSAVICRLIKMTPGMTLDETLESTLIPELNKHLADRRGSANLLGTIILRVDPW